jgi:hypothetical protein
MTKPVPTGKRYQEAYELLEQLAHDGGKEALNAFYFAIGDDKEALIATLKVIIDRFDQFETAMSKMSRQQIHAALELLTENKD